MQYFDLKNLNYYCDAKGHLEQPTICKEEPYDSFDFFSLSEAKTFVSAFRAYMRTPLFMFSGQQVIRLETYCFNIEKFIRNSSFRMLTLIKTGKTAEEFEELKQFREIFRKGMKYLRKFNITLNKLAYKYNKINWINMVFQDNLLELMFYTDDFYLFFEIISTLTVFVKEEGLSSTSFKLNSIIKEKIKKLFSFFLKKEKTNVNKFYCFLQKEEKFEEIKNKTEELFCKNKPEISHFSYNFQEYTFEEEITLESLKFSANQTIKLEIFDSKTGEISVFSAFSENFDEETKQNFENKPDFLNIFFLLKLRKFQREDPFAFPLMISLIFLNIHQLYIKWNEISSFYKEILEKSIKTELFSTNAYKDGFLLIHMNSIEFLRNSVEITKYYLETMSNFLTFSGKLSEIYGNNEHNLAEFLDFTLETFSKNLEFHSEKPKKYLIPLLKRLKTLFSQEILNLSLLKSKKLFDNIFSSLFFSVFNEKTDIMDPIHRKRVINMNNFLDYLTIHIMTEESEYSQSFLKELEKFYKKILDVFLEKQQDFFLPDENLNKLYQSLLGLIIFAFNHSRSNFFEDLLYNYKLISKFDEVLHKQFDQKFVDFSHTILNNSLLNIFKKINVNEFIADFKNQEIQSFMTLFQRLTNEENLVIYRGVFVNYGSILLKHGFSLYNSLEQYKENPNLYEKTLIFVEVYIKDFILWTVNGYNDYPGFPKYIRIVFKEKFIEFLQKIKKIAEADEKSLKEIYQKITKYKSFETIPSYYTAFIQFLTYKFREILLAINRLRDHFIIDPENDIFFTENDMKLFMEINQKLQTPFSYNTSKVITLNYAKECYYIRENSEKTSQLRFFLEIIAKNLPKLQENLVNYFENYAKSFPFIKVFNSDKNLYKAINTLDIFQDFQRANHILGFLKQSKNFDEFSEIITEINQSEILLGYYEIALKGFIHLENVPETQENELYALFETNFAMFFEIYLFLIEKMSEEMSDLLMKNYENLLKKHGEIENQGKNPLSLEKNKHKYAVFIGFIQTKVLGKKYSRKIFKKMDLFNYISSFLKHIYLWNKNKASKTMKNKLNDLILFYFTQAKKKFLEKIQLEKDNSEDFLWYFTRISFIFSELYRLSGHLSGISENYKNSSFLNENSDLFQVLADLFEKIINLLKKHEVVYKWELETDKKTDITYFQDYFSFIFCKYFHCNLFNEFLFPRLQTEMLNIKENITMDSHIYEEKIQGIFTFIKKYSQIWVLLNKNEENIPDSLQKNYEKYYTKDPKKVTNYITYGNKVIEFFLFLIYESKIRIKSNNIFLIIHTKLRAIPNAHKEKHVYVAYFGKLLENHFKQIYPSWEISSSKRFSQILWENQEKIPELSLNFEPKVPSDLIYSICLQALHINLIARLIQNTNDKDPNIPKGIEMIFDTWEAKFEYVKYINEAFSHILTNKVNNDDHYAIFDETVFRGKDFIGFLANNLKDITDEKLLDSIDLFIKFITNYLRIPIAKENLGSSFVRLFNENKLDLSPILLSLGVLSQKKEKIIVIGIDKILVFLKDLLNLQYEHQENITDFYSLQGFYVFLIIERILWISASKKFKRNLAENRIKNSFYDKNEKIVKNFVSFEEFSKENANYFNGFGEETWETIFELCEFKNFNNENSVFLKKNGENFENCEKIELSELQKRILEHLIESFISYSLKYLTNCEKIAGLNKNGRKEAKKNQKFLLINQYFLLQILTRILKKMPILASFILFYRIPETYFENSFGMKLFYDFCEIFPENAKEVFFFDFLFMIFPYFNNAVFSLFHVVFESSTLFFKENSLLPNESKKIFSLNFLLKKELISRILKKFSFLSEKTSIFSEIAVSFELYYTISLIILIFNHSKQEDLELEHYKKALNCCFRIFSQAKTKDNFTFLNNMNVFFALMKNSLKNINKLQFQQSIKGEKYDKEAINYFFNKNIYKILETAKKSDKSLEKTIEEPFDENFMKNFMKNYEYNPIKEKISLESEEILRFLKEKNLIKHSIESFVEQAKIFSFFSKKTEICGFLKHVSFADNYRDFYKLFKQKNPEKIDSKLIFLKKIVKKSINLMPNDISDVEYSLKKYEESGFFFEKEEKKDALSLFQNILSEFIKLSSLSHQQESFELLKSSSNPSIPLQKNPSIHPELYKEEEFPIEISYDFELYGFPKNALSLYGVDIGIFLTLPDDEKGNFLNEARTNFEEKSKEISPELIQFLFDFEGNGFPPDALLKYGIDPLYFMEMPEDYKFSILDEARKKFNLDMKQLIEKEKENERMNYAKIKEKIILIRELALITDKGCRIIKEKRENLEENQWKIICDDIMKLKDEGIKANILKRMSNELINELPNELKKIAYKYRRDLIDFNKNSKLQEEFKENLIPKPENPKKNSAEINNFLNFDEKNEVKQPENQEKYKRIEALILKSDFLDKMLEIPDEILWKFIQAFVQIDKKNPKKDEDSLFKTRYFLKVLKYLFKNPMVSYKLLDGIMFLLNDYEEYNDFLEKNLETSSQFLEILPNLTNSKEKIQEINEIQITIIDFLIELINKNSALTLILQLRSENYTNIRYNSIEIDHLSFKELNEIRNFLRKRTETPVSQKNFLTIFFELLKKSPLENPLIDLISSFDSKLSLEEGPYKENSFEDYPIIPLFIDKKEDLLKKLVFHPQFFDKNCLKSFLRIFVTDLKDFKLILTLLLSIFFDKFNKSLEETKEIIENFKLGHNIANLKENIKEETKIALLITFYEEIIEKFFEFKNFSRGLKYLFARFRKVFKKSCYILYTNEYMEKIQRNEDIEIIRSWFQEKEKTELSHYISFMKPVLESDDNVKFFKNIINNIDFLIEFIGDDCSQVNSQITSCYKIFKCGFKAFIYVYSFLNPLEEVEYENLEKEDVSNEIPQLSKLLTLEVEDKKKEKIFHLDEVFEMLNEKFCPILDYYVKSCSNTHNNNNLSHAWRYLIQKNTNFSTLSADTKFILIKNIAKERAKKITNQPNRRNTHQITIKRNTIWNCTLEKLMLLKPAELTLDDFKIEFENEEGWDAGGLRREWLSLLSREIFNPDMGLFQLSANGVSYQPSSLSYIIPDHLIHFRFVGRMIAKCLIENWNFGVYFPKSFLKHILKKNLNLRDLEDIDGSLARSLEWILSNPVDPLESVFTYERKEFDEIKVFDLVKDGSNIKVTEENKREFVKIFASTKMGLEIQQQAQMLIQGIHEIIPARAISLLDEKELGLKIAGMPEINIDEMKEFAIIIEKYNNNTTDWLFEILEEYDDKMRAQFLFFTSGAFRVPNEGFKQLPLKISKVNNKNALPVAHTCFNQIDLPEYDSKLILKQKLEKAITEGAIGFFLH